MFKQTIVRRPAKSLINGITSAPELGKPDYELALRQHENYVEALKQCGVEVVVLDAMEAYPDSCFVEDVAVCTRHCAIITNPGAQSRNGETAGIVDTIRKFYPAEKIEVIEAPGSLEGGDVMMVGDHFYVGLSARTNQEGADQFFSALKKHGMTGEVVPLKEVLHLKTGLAYLERNHLLVGGEFVTSPVFKDFKKVIVPPDESYACNCIWVNDTVIVPAGYPKTQSEIETLGYNVIVVDTSEYRKLDGGLSCLSLRF